MTVAAEWPAWIDRLDFNVPGYGASDEFLAGVESFRMSVRAYTSGNMDAYRRGEWPAPTDTDPVGRPGQQQGDQQWPESDGQ